MPPTPKNNTKPKKHKGRAPAHQNEFAWTHNPKSKMTERILASPIIHVCKRCNEKLEWRKQYRKYKPRTQPGMCNGCKKRNVKSAYHTICVSCTTESVKAMQIIQEATDAKTAKKAKSTSSPGTKVSFETTKTAKSTSTTEKEEILRVCAVCVKEVALPDPVEEGDDTDYIDAMSRLKLREKRALERKIVKQEEEATAAAANKKKKTPSESAGDDNDSKVEDRVQQHHQQAELSTLNENDEESVEEGKNFEDNDDSDDDYDDPFLKAIGGSILTGEAYQKKLLEQHQQEK
jgi:hypothetical protein